MNTLRPIERRIAAMRSAGDSVEEIARRFKRTEDHVRRILAWIEIPRSRPPARRRPSALQSRVLALRDSGMSHDDIARRFGRGARWARQMEGMGRMVTARDELTFEYGMTLLSAAADEARDALDTNGPSNRATRRQSNRGDTR